MGQKAHQSSPSLILMMAAELQKEDQGTDNGYL